MGTTKLGLKIVRSYQGYGEGFCVNENQAWTKSLRDLREDCKHVSGLEENCENSVLFYSAVPAGEFYTIVSKIPGRQTDFISAWIFCPADIEISGSDLTKAIEATRAEILAEQVNEEKLKNLFSREYPQSAVQRNCTVTNGNDYAVRFYGARFLYNGLPELLDSTMSQPSNSKYKGIFLIDKDSSIDNVDCDDISMKPLKNSVIINPPQESNGFVPYLNETRFTEQRRAVEGEKFKIVWKKKGYKDIEKESIAQGPNTQYDEITDRDIYKYVNYSDFRFTDDYFKVIKEGITLKLNHTVLEPGQRLAVPISYINNSMISVSCSGYKDYSEYKDLSKSDSFNIVLKSRSYTYNCRLPLNVDEDVVAECTATIESNKSLTHCPIEGYRSGSGMFTGGVNRLYYEKPKNKKRDLIFAGIGALVGILIGAIVIAFFANKAITKIEEERDSLKQEQVAKQEQERKEKEEKRSPEGAINYLDHNSTWKRSEMETYDRLKGVWDEVNSYELDKLSQKGELMKSNKYKELCEQLKALKEVGGEMKGKWEEKNEDINISNYTDRVRNKVREACERKSLTENKPQTKEQPKQDGKKNKHADLDL